MAYTLEEFRNEVNAHGGYECLLVMNFNNGFRQVFTKGQVFDEAVNLDVATETLKFECRDNTRIEYVVTRKLMYLEGMVFAKNAEERDRISLYNAAF